MNIVKEILTLKKQVKQLYCFLTGEGNPGGGGSGIETDPTVPQYVKDITEQNILEWQDNKTEGFKVSAPAGGYKLGDNVISGMHLDAFAKALLTTVSNPSFTDPSLSLSPILPNREVGTILTNLSLTASFYQGEIKGKNIGGVWIPSATQATRAGLPSRFTVAGELFITTELSVTKVITSYTTVVGSNRFDASVTYSNGTNIPVNSVGEEVGTALVGNSLSASLFYQGGYMRFAGMLDTIPTSGLELRNKMINFPKTELSGYGTFTFQTGTTKRILVVALEEGKVITKADNISTNDPLTFTKLTTVTQVPDAAGVNKNYNVYIFKMDIPMPEDYTIKIVTN